MSGPIPIAYAALCARIAGALANAGFITAADVLAIDPDSAVEIDGDARDLESVAAVVQLGTAPVRTFLGRGPGFVRYAVERQVRLELAIASPDRQQRDQVLDAALAALAPLCDADPTLSGAAERCGLSGREDDDLPPNGRKVFLTFFVRARSADPLGLTAG